MLLMFFISVIVFIEGFFVLVWFNIVCGFFGVVVIVVIGVFGIVCEYYYFNCLVDYLGNVF